jgi:hypothetical protein
MVGRDEIRDTILIEVAGRDRGKESSTMRVRPHGTETAVTVVQ